MRKTRHTRTLYAGTVDNSQLVGMVVKAARMAARSMRWPQGLPREDAARIVHEYIRRRVKYDAEPASDQVVRLPSATVKQRKADCKSTAVFIASAAAAAGRRVDLRFIRQKRGDHWSHVYAVVDGVAVDPLLRFGREAIHSQSMDVPIAMNA